MKILFTLAFLLSLNLTPIKAWPTYPLYLSLILALFILSRLRIISLIKRGFFATPFILAAIPLVFWGPAPLIGFQVGEWLRFSYSPLGLERFISIAIKAWLSIQMIILLTATTQSQKIISALPQLHLPKLLSTIIALMWRYLFVIVDETTRMIKARNSRSATAAGSSKAGGTILWQAKVTGGMAGNLFLRSIERSERIYSAMLARGYTGEIPENTHTPITAGGRKVLFAGILMMICLLGLGILIG